MTVTGAQSPRWVHAILCWRWTWLLARIGLLSAYLVVAQLGGSLLLIWGRFVWLAAGTLGALTFVATFAADHFWAMTGQARFAATNAFFEHFGLISGFVMAALLADHDERKTQLPTGRT